jgi:GntR family transcriptional regulator
VINPNTVARVYTELEREGVLSTRPGLGVFVAQPRNDLTKKARKDRLTALADPFLTEAVHLGFSAEEALALVSERMAKFQFPQPIGSE